MSVCVCVCACACVCSHWVRVVVRRERSELGPHVCACPFPLHYPQLYMMRTMLESLISDKTGAAKKPLKLDLKDSSIPDFESFHRASFFYSKMLDLSCECVHACECVCVCV